jgi:hypothetical protein
MNYSFLSPNHNIHNVAVRKNRTNHLNGNITFTLEDPVEIQSWKLKNDRKSFRFIPFFVPIWSPEIFSAVELVIARMFNQTVIF